MPPPPDVQVRQRKHRLTQALLHQGQRELENMEGQLRPSLRPGSTHVQTNQVCLQASRISQSLRTLAKNTVREIALASQNCVRHATAKLATAKVQLPGKKPALVSTLPQGLSTLPTQDLLALAMKLQVEESTNDSQGEVEAEIIRLRQMVQELMDMINHLNRQMEEMAKLYAASGGSPEIGQEMDAIRAEIAEARAQIHCIEIQIQNLENQLVGT